MTIVYAADGTTFPPRGVLGGGTGKASETIKLQANGGEEVLPAFAEVVIEEGAKIAFTASGGGGYGDPRKRDPQRVLATANRGWLSVEAALRIYGVMLVPDENEPGTFKIDAEKTTSDHQ
ncbi:hydantoinase B/oxoprolinase family protein [Brucella rhizosphaerae]